MSLEGGKVTLGRPQLKRVFSEEAVDKNRFATMDSLIGSLGPTCRLLCPVICSYEIPLKSSRSNSAFFVLQPVEDETKTSVREGVVQEMQYFVLC